MVEEELLCDVVAVASLVVCMFVCVCVCVLRMKGR